MRNSKSSLMAAALAAVAMSGMSVGGAGGFTPAQAAQARGTQGTQTVQKQSPSRTGERNSNAKAMFGSMGGPWRSRRYPNGPGWTHAHVARMKTKRKNVARNKRAHRG